MFPVFLLPSYIGTIGENLPQDTSILTVEATISGGHMGQLEYILNLTGNAEGNFYIDTYTGIIRSSHVFDYENDLRVSSLNFLIFYTTTIKSP